MSLFKAVLTQFAEVILPASCISCYQPLGPRAEVGSAISLLCDECREILRPLRLLACCSHCGMVPRIPATDAALTNRCHACEKLPDTFTEARSAFPYDSPAGNIVRNMKYQRAPFLAPHLNELAIPVLSDWFSARIDRDTCVLGLPMAVGRHLKKGYNQAVELASSFAKSQRLKFLEDGIIVRARSGTPQARHHSRSARVANVADAFHVKKFEEVSGRSILLVDDVMTTGATVSSAAAALMKAGALAVYVYTPVRARLGEDDDDASETAYVS